MSTDVQLSYKTAGPGSVRSLWLDQAERDADGTSERPPLTGSERADVCIVGGGFTGLWTALALKGDDPSLDVVVLEADTCGAGASGRNGGFVMSWWSKFGSLKKLCGTEEALRLARASADSVVEIGRFCAEHGIDAEYHHDGWLWTATSPSQVGDWDATIAAVEAAGVRAFERLPNDEVAARAHSPVHLAGVFEPTQATVHPGRLSRGLARVVAERGVRIFEDSPVTRISLGATPTVRTAGGEVSADRVVLAINAWGATLEELKRSLIVVASDVITTPRIPDRLQAIGWTDGVGISDSRRLVNYYRRTDDGRVVFGKGGGTLGFSGVVGRAFHRPSPREHEVAAQFHRLYPMLWDVTPERSWRGPIDYSTSGMPSFTRIQGRRDVIVAAGFSGNGVGPAHVAGRILASLVQDLDDAWATTGLVRQPGGGLPPEPFRFVGGLAVRRATALKEDAQDSGRDPARLVKLVSSLDPTSFVDRSPAPAGEIPSTKETGA